MIFFLQILSMWYRLVEYLLKILPLHYFSGTPCPPYKIVVLDEADSMTTHAQVSQGADFYDFRYPQSVCKKIYLLTLLKNLASFDLFVSGLFVSESY